jgi:hypothetical protein
MKFQIKSGEVMILLAASVMSLLANLPDSLLGNIVDKKWLLGTLAALVVVAMFRYLQMLLLLTISILAIGANLPSELAATLGISQFALLVSLATLVAISLLNRAVKLLPIEREIPSPEISDGHQAMLAAIAEGDKATLFRLFAMHRSANFTENGTTPLHLAAEKGNPDIVQMLISHGADFRKKNAAGKTPMEIVLDKKKFIQPKEKHLSATVQWFVANGQSETRGADADLWIHPQGY